MTTDKLSLFDDSLGPIQPRPALDRHVGMVRARQAKGVVQLAPDDASTTAPETCYTEAARLVSERRPLLPWLRGPLARMGGGLPRSAGCNRSEGACAADPMDCLRGASLGHASPSLPQGLARL